MEIKIIDREAEVKSMSAGSSFVTTKEDVGSWLSAMRNLRVKYQVRNQRDGKYLIWRGDGPAPKRWEGQFIFRGGYIPAQ